MIFLGQDIAEMGVHIIQSKLNTVVDWPVPKMMFLVTSFLSFMNFFQHLLENLAKVSAPLK